MNATAFSVTYLAIVTAAGLVNHMDLAWQMAAVTAAIAFFANAIHDYSVDGASRTANALSLLSWLTGAIAGLSLLF